MPTLADCPELPPCPPHAPYRCPSGECVENAATCAPGIRCPSNKPYLCSNGTCVKAADLCPIIETCPTGYLMCYDGSCVDHNSVCLPPPVCPSLSIRCLDGSCRSAVDLEEAVLDYFGAAPAYETCVNRKLEESSVEVERRANCRTQTRVCAQRRAICTAEIAARWTALSGCRSIRSAPRSTTTCFAATAPRKRTSTPVLRS